ncbi:hypothetical protein [Kribbella sp. NPDC051770]|uniref:hypothetical protein n=1 Tax=Kribbella sp. NPDC051770 TaxID=3155413 RepID=UPI0034314513
MGDELIRCCVDRTLEDDLVLEAAERAVDERPANAPDAPKPRTKQQRLRLALETRRMWSNGRTLRIAFLDGSAAQREGVRALATEWTNHAKLRFAFVDDPRTAEVRIAFVPGGSWSLVGTEALTAAPSEPTMNFGWLREDEPDEWQPVVLHEFGHAIGCVHEHSSPAAGIPWDLPAVYRHYGGPLNGWSDEEIERNLLTKYATSQTRHTAFDPRSIMLYAIPPELTAGRYEVKANRTLSVLDREFIAQSYPATDAAATILVCDGPPQDARIATPDATNAFHFTIDHPGEYRLETSGYTDLKLQVFRGGTEAPIADIAEGGLGGNVRVELALMEGDYRVEVRHRRPTGTGRYRIALHEVPAR